MVWEAETCSSAQHPGRPPDYIKGQLGGFVLHNSGKVSLQIVENP